ncbi:MAG: hypothetical protein EPN25_02565 [Nitrospirae bacterium]|nr:MAG: hypothetical protein EPN25_02565 [Nitrospirota bacterium]
MKKILFIALIVAVAFGGYLAFTTVDAKTAVVSAAKAKIYDATVYVAGHGGHFAKADVSIDPNNADDPIKIKALDKVDIGDTKTHKTHDARIDSNDSTVLFWSTYQLDANGKQHVGKSDLKTGKVLMDVAMDTDPRSTGGEKKMPIYCASGQSKDYYMPVFMGSEAYVDVISKKDLKLKHRVFISDLGYKAGSYQFLHGTNSNKMDKFILTMTMKGEDGKMNGKIDFVMVDLKELEKGKFKELKRVTHTGVGGKTITFRMYFSKDDKQIFQSAGDRFWLLDANTLAQVDEKMSTGGENHDAIPTPDGKFGILTVRNGGVQACDVEGKPILKDGKNINITDGQIQLYDVEAKKIVGKTASTCFGCHKGMGLGDKTAILCGIDANFKK